jgi:hypothetical protein
VFVFLVFTVPLGIFFISGIPSVIDTYRQFTTLACALFSRNDPDLPFPAGDIEEIIGIFSLKAEPSRPISEINYIPWKKSASCQ